MSQGWDQVTQGTLHVTGMGPQWHRGTPAWHKDKTLMAQGDTGMAWGQDPSGTGDPTHHGDATQ